MPLIHLNFKGGYVNQFLCQLLNKQNFDNLSIDIVYLDNIKGKF
jgi:hypothetical protein